MKIKQGDRVTCRVVWKDGRVTTSEGTFMFYGRDGKAYVETAAGPVEVDASTVEKVS